MVAFEPSPELVKYLRFHKRMNLLTQMEIVPKAVTKADVPAIPFILVGDGDDVMNSLVEIEDVKSSPRGWDCDSGGSHHSGHLFSAERSCSQDDQDRYEGSEIWVCEGAKHLLARERPILIVATHPTWLPHGQKIEDLFRLLRGYGYRIVASETMQYNKIDFGDYLLIAE